MRSREQGVQGGGILADAMGMGKTVSIIALILACPLPGKDETRKRMSYAPDPTRGPINNGVTLIVAPASLLRQWQKEIESKTEPKLNVLRYESAGKLRYPAWHLNLFHVILVSYETLLSDYNTEVCTSLVYFPLPFTSKLRKPIRRRKYHPSSLIRDINSIELF